MTISTLTAQPCSLLSFKGENFDNQVFKRSQIKNDGNGKANIGCLIIDKHQYLLCCRFQSLQLL